MASSSIVLATCILCLLVSGIKADIPTWAWMSGSNSPHQPGIYGIKGVPSTNNVPGARFSAVGWYDDTAEELWVFGGMGYGSNAVLGK